MFNLFKNKHISGDKLNRQYEILLESIQEIKNTKGFQELINHWENLYNAIEVKIDNSTCPKEVFNLTRERAVIRKHYLFMKNLADGNISTEGR